MEKTANSLGCELNSRLAEEPVRPGGLCGAIWKVKKNEQEKPLGICFSSCPDDWNHRAVATRHQCALTAGTDSPGGSLPIQY